MMQVILFAIIASISFGEHVNDHTGLNPLKIPAVRGHYLSKLAERGIDHGARHRHLQVNEETKEFPHVYDSYEFVGATDAGFVDYKYSAIVSSTTVNLDDYLNLALGSTFSCTPFDTTFTEKTSDKPTWSEGILERNNVVITMTVSDSLALAHPTDISHLETRLVANSGLVFGLDFLAAHPDFISGSHCVAQVPYTSPYFTVQGVFKSNKDGKGVTYSLQLVPTTPFTIFKQLSFNVQHDPNVTREVTRRLQANEPLGSDVRSDRRLEIKLDKDLVDFNMNYDAKTEKAATSVIELFGSSMAGAATCTECYAYATGKLVANIKFCMDIFFTGNQKNYAFDTTNYSGEKKITELPDCISMKTVGASTSSYGEGASKPSNKNVMMGLEAEAYIEGAIGMNFEFSSSGIAASKTMTNVNIITDKVLPAVTVLVGGFPVSITPTIGLFASTVGAKGKVEGSIKFGAGGSATAKLGGKISFPSIRDPVETTKINTPIWTSYKSFSMKSKVVPFTMTKIKAAADMHMHLQPKMILTIYNAIPVQINPELKTMIKLATSSRRILEVSANEPIYSLRRLQTCPSGATSYGASASATLNVGVSSAAANKIVNGIFDSFGSANPLNQYTGASTLINAFQTEVVPATTFLKDEPIVPAFDIVSPGCTTATGDAAPAPLAPPSPSGGSDSSTSSGLSGGAIAGIVIAVLFIVTASAGIGYYVLVVKAAEATAAATSKAAVVVVDNSVTVRSVDPTATKAI